MFKTFLILEADMDQIEDMDSGVALRELRDRLQELNAQKKEVMTDDNNPTKNEELSVIDLEERLIRQKMMLIQKKEQVKAQTQRGI